MWPDGVGEEALPANYSFGRSRLIGDVVALQRAAGGVRILTRRQLDGVKPAAREQEQLVLAYAGAHGAQLAPEPQALAQQPPLGVPAAIDGGGKFHRHQVEPRQLIRQLLHPVDGGEAYAESPRPPPPAPWVLAQFCERHDQRRAVRGVLAEVNPVVRDDLTPPQDASHRRSP